MWIPMAKAVAGTIKGRRFKNKNTFLYFNFSITRALEAIVPIIVERIPTETEINILEITTLRMFLAAYNPLTDNFVGNKSGKRQVSENPQINRIKMGSTIIRPTRASRILFNILFSFILFLNVI
jgi:hypothetical protein